MSYQKKGSPSMTQGSSIFLYISLMGENGFDFVFFLTIDDVRE